jgi:hypothetical protein
LFCSVGRPHRARGPGGGPPRRVTHPSILPWITIYGKERVLQLYAERASPLIRAKVLDFFHDTPARKRTLGSCALMRRISGGRAHAPRRFAVSSCRPRCAHLAPPLAHPPQSTPQAPSRPRGCSSNWSRARCRWRSSAMLPRPLVVSGVTTMGAARTLLLSAVCPGDTRRSRLRRTLCHPFRRTQSPCQRGALQLHSLLLPMTGRRLLTGAIPAHTALARTGLRTAGRYNPNKARPGWEPRAEALRQL